MRLPVLALCVALLATACGDDGSDADAPDTDVYDRLSLEAASAIVGVGYTANGQAREICFYQRPGTDQAFKLSVIAYQDDFDQVVADSEGIGYTATVVEVAGADRAVALAGPNRSVVAEQDGSAYEVSFNGSVATARRLMAVVIGGDVSGTGPRPVRDPCESLSPPQVRRLLGVPARARPGTREPALKSCTWRAGRRELVVAAGRGRGPVGEFWDENFFVAEGVEPESLRVPGADGALLVASRRDDAAGLAVARGDLSYVVTVAGGVPDHRNVAVRAASLLLGEG